MYGVIEGTVDVYPKNLEETLYLFGEKGTVKAGKKAVWAVAFTAVAMVACPVAKILIDEDGD